MTFSNENSDGLISDSSVRIKIISILPTTHVKVSFDIFENFLILNPVNSAAVCICGNTAKDMTVCIR